MKKLFTMKNQRLTSQRRKRLARPAFIINAPSGNVTIANSKSGDWLRSMMNRDRINSPKGWMIKDAVSFFNRGQKFRFNRLQASQRKLANNNVTVRSHQRKLDSTPFDYTQSLAYHLASVGYA